MTVADKLDVDALLAEIEESGYVVIPSLISTDLARRAADRLMEMMVARPDSGSLGQNLHGLFNYSEPEDDELFVPLINNPTYVAVARRMLGEGLQLAAAAGGCNWWKPGAAAQRIHVDVPNGWFVKNGFPVPNVCLFVNCLWMLTDFTQENGGTRVIPFTHHSGRAPRAGVEYPSQISAVGPAGSIVIFDGRVWHGAGPNVSSDSQRVGLAVGYHSAALDPTPPMTNWVPVKRSTRDRLPEDVQKMLRWVTDADEAPAKPT